MNLYNWIEALSIVLFLIALYTFFLYPFIIKFLSKYFFKEIKENGHFEPEISILIAAYNEENYIKDAILSLENSNYPNSKMEILIGLDGTTDNTSNIIKELQRTYNNIQFWEFPRSGKNFIINNLIAKSSKDFIFFLDADLRVRKDSLHKLVNKFSDESVGGVMAGLNIINHTGLSDDNNTGRLGETTYQKIETMIRESESKIFGNTNGLGTLYGVRKSNLTFQPNDKVCDDFFIVLYTALCNKRFIFDKNIIVDEVRKKSLSAEMKRRVRLVAGGLSTIFAVKQLLLPKYGWSSFFIWSHKLLRYSSPFILIFFAISSILLPFDSFLKIPLIISQLVFYFLVFLGWLFDKFNINIRILRIFLFVFMMNISFLVGVFKFILGGQNSKWEKIN